MRNRAIGVLCQYYQDVNGVRSQSLIVQQGGQRTLGHSESGLTGGLDCQRFKPDPRLYLIRRRAERVRALQIVDPAVGEVG